MTIPSQAIPSQTARCSRRDMLLRASALPLGLLLTGCSSLPVQTTRSGPRAAAPTIVRVSHIPGLISGPLYVAAEKGYFREANLDVELLEIWQASETLAGLASGNLEAGAGGIGAALMNGIQRGLGIRIVAPLHTERPPVTTPLVVGKALWDGGTVRSVADLRGRRVAVNSRGSATEYWLAAALATGGLSPRDVDLQTLAFPDAVAAMENGALDGAMVGEPVATLGERKGAIVRLAESFVDEFQVTAVYLADRFAQEQREAGEAFVGAFLRAARDLDGDGYRAPENLEILERRTKVPVELIAAARRPYHDPDGRVRVSDFQKLHDFFLAEGALAFSDPLDMGALVDARFAESARARLTARR
jgi:NitT/TauT family transport system substrate-binding protein